MERKLATAEKRIRTLDTQVAAHRQQIKELERERALAQTELAESRLRHATQELQILAVLYTVDPVVCGKLCDTVLDPSGALLGRVREVAGGREDSDA